MKINWKDFGVTLLLFIIASITVYHPFDFSFILAIFLGDIYFLINLLVAMLPTFFASLILIFYIWRNKQASYKEVAIISFLIPLITLVIFYIYAVIATIELPSQTTEFTVADSDFDCYKSNVTAVVDLDSFRSNRFCFNSKEASKDKCWQEVLESFKITSASLWEIYP